MGKEHGSKPSLSTVVQVYKNFTAGWKWNGRGRISLDVMSSTRNVSLASLLPRASS
jgi:hypothetical protein